ncbi:hypothetical protein ASG31_13195 [Chryseobacterium sp. Leaf404]|uniref:hypothetical protein n=1 Tax=unclassified Chryseobacterium TaxID=2593645 RepID=UPI0006F2DCD9|nr:MULTISPECIES: hypothetical protein [unclassified Chryseobacterium]KQT16464.1 hypothetical protein ASG31_13195 [Chryseobacterium sp. Leaf404]
MNDLTNKHIRNALVVAFVKKDPKYFISFLKSEIVIVDRESKLDFYKLFRNKILHSKVRGKIKEIKVEKEFNGFYDDYLQLNIYDGFHKNPRFSIFYKYDNEKIHLGFMPF